MTDGEKMAWLINHGNLIVKPKGRNKYAWVEWSAKHRPSLPWSINGDSEDEAILEMYDIIKGWVWEHCEH